MGIRPTDEKPAKLATGAAAGELHASDLEGLERSKAGGRHGLLAVEVNVEAKAVIIAG